MTGLRALVATFALAVLPTLAAAPDEPLEADRAFRPSARLVAGSPADSARHGIDIDYRIAAGYYLYRDRMRFEVLPATLLVAPAELPAGQEVDDPFLGKSVIYRDKATFHLPFTTSSVRPGQYRVRITAQGCAENRLCYAPFVQELPLNIPPGYRVVDSAPPADPMPRPMPRSQPR
jgi:thiol:disulfide interchange protein DsbD